MNGKILHTNSNWKRTEVDIIKSDRTDIKSEETDKDTMCVQSSNYHEDITANFYLSLRDRPNICNKTLQN